MPSTRAIAFLVAATMLSACSTGPDLTVSAKSCDLGQHQRLLGMNIGEVYLPAQLNRREISPGQVVTFDYQPQRLNIFLDPKGWISRVTCG